ncbi:MAG: hypothetical protein JXB03_07745 [Spirochaetales bacterium]|nr:hypothetical protein [Spirochaetales bacterium]
MEITFIIVSGLVLMTAFASGFDYLTKRRNRLDADTKTKVTRIEQKLHDLENTLHERDERILQLENDLAFLSRLLEKK